jgi:hypothetical protein
MGHGRFMWGGAASVFEMAFESDSTENRVFTVDWLTLGLGTLDASPRYDGVRTHRRGRGPRSCSRSARPANT